MEEEFYRLVGRNIRERRIAKGWSLEKLGGRLGVSYQQAQKYEKGINRLPAHVLVQLASDFGCSLDELCGFRPSILSAELIPVLQRIDRLPSEEMRGWLIGLMDAAAAMGERR